MPRKPKPSEPLPELLDARVMTAPCVPRIREKVKAWRDGGCKGVTDTTRALLNHWFHADHRLPNGRRFRYHDFQREAIETLIYLYEAAGVRSHKALVETFAVSSDLRLLRYDDFARYCVKMATGSGKTKVMSLAVAWQYFNAVAEPRDDYAKTFLVIAPNVIVFERLRQDFAGGRIFGTDPIIPEQLRVFWDFQFYMRGEAERAGSLGALYLTNIQQFYKRPDGATEEPAEMTAVMGPKPPTQRQEIEDFGMRIAARGGPVVILNDEAHHTHEEESEWNKTLRRLHEDVSHGVGVQLDFTATPRHTKGQLFSWTVYDYPLKQAVIDNVVKRPLKGIAKGIAEAKSPVASTKYQAYLVAGVERWKEYREQLRPLNRKPVLFVMMNKTAEADEVADWLRKKYPSEFGGESLLVIHTDTKGEITKKDLESAREAARAIDKESSPINCIVSVLMLREGWDVESVTVIVGLRPYSAEANILPEQTVGRGLRLTFRDMGTGYQERVDVIGNSAFIEFVEQLEREEDIEFETFEIGKDKVIIVTIAPDSGKMDKDITIPELSPILARKKSLADEIDALDVASFSCPELPRREGDKAAQDFRYEGYDVITLQKIVEREPFAKVLWRRLLACEKGSEYRIRGQFATLRGLTAHATLSSAKGSRDYMIPEPQTAEEVIGYYAQRIAREVKLPGQFAALVPRVREFLATRAFGEPVNLDQPAMVKAISRNVAQYVTVKTFAEALHRVVVEELEPQLLHSGRRLSETPPFPWSRPTLAARKCVLNLVPCDNEFEKAFARFLERAEDVERFSKMPELFGFCIEYTDNVGNLRYYEPDFIAVTDDGVQHLIETKGLEDMAVVYKDRAAQLWCENATRLTGVPWAYLKVRQGEYESLQPTSFADLKVSNGEGFLVE